MASSFFDNKLAPIATYNCASLGNIISLSSNFNTLLKRSLRLGKKWRGPPKKATLPSIFLPQDKTLTVWTTTALNMLMAMSLLLAPSFIRGWISVLANTPHLDAIG